MEPWGDITLPPCADLRMIFEISAVIFVNIKTTELLIDLIFLIY
jgi:hypothetical protein